MIVNSKEKDFEMYKKGEKPFMIHEDFPNITNWRVNLIKFQIAQIFDATETTRKLVKIFFEMGV